MFAKCINNYKENEIKKTISSFSFTEYGHRHKELAQFNLNLFN